VSVKDASCDGPFFYPSVGPEALPMWVIREDPWRLPHLNTGIRAQDRAERAAADHQAIASRIIDVGVSPVSS